MKNTFMKTVIAAALCTGIFFITNTGARAEEQITNLMPLHKTGTDRGCQHTGITETILTEPTCTEKGTKEIFCMDCGKKIKTSDVPASGHDIITKTTIVASCEEEGLEREICARCHICISETQIEKTEHDFLNWEVIKEATPFEKGIKERYCPDCRLIQKQEYSLNITDEYLYIPAIKVSAPVAAPEDETYEEASLNDLQILCDTNDIIRMSLNDFDHHVICGHNYGSFKTLKNLNTGDYIYIWMHGKMHTYRVALSESGKLTDDGLISDETGTDLTYDRYGEDILRIYTCNAPGKTDLRWMVFADRVS